MPDEAESGKDFTSDLFNDFPGLFNPLSISLKLGSQLKGKRNTPIHGFFKGAISKDIFEINRGVNGAFKNGIETGTRHFQIVFGPY
jgi:hypothetical protein